jgi:hypothetical protein
MFKKLRVRFTYVNVTATIAVVLAVGGGAVLAVGAVPGPDGVIHSCFKNKKGALRISKTGACKANKETALAWNQTGPQGKRGKQGLQGLKGIQGVPGPTESTSATNPVPIDSEFDLTNSDSPTIDLSAVNGDAGSQQISPSFASRIVATASVTLENDDATLSTVVCKLQISDGSGPTNGMTNISPEMAVTFPATANYATVVTITGAATKPAGAYNIRMVCKEGIEGAKVSTGSITAIATAQ